MSTESSTNGAATYLRLLYEVWPVMMVAFMVAMFTGWTGVKQSYLQHNVVATVINIILSSAVMALIAVAVTWVLPLLGYEMDPAIQMGVVVLVASSGMKTMDAIILRLLGARILRVGSGEDLLHMKQAMTLEQQRQHMEMCPYRGECATCRGCPRVVGRRAGDKSDGEDVRTADHV